MTFNPFESAGGAGITGPAGRAASITPGSGNLTDATTGEEYVARALVCETKGTITYEDIDGYTRTNFPLVAGWNPLGAVKVTAFNGTNLWGIKG